MSNKATIRGKSRTSRPKHSKGALARPKRVLDSKPLSDGLKAYKLLALQEGISTNKAKQLIDSGLVQVGGKRLELARALLRSDTKLVVIDKSYEKVFEDSNLLVIDKGIGLESYEIEKPHAPSRLINRLDRDTSGILLLAKNDSFRKKALEEFRARRVEKVYFALVEGRLSTEQVIEADLRIDRAHGRAFVVEDGLKAISMVRPLALMGKKSTLVEVRIITGRTHQIRAHLAHIKHPIIGDVIYNKTDSRLAKRLMLHCYKTKIFDMEFISFRDAYAAFGVC